MSASVRSLGYLTGRGGKPAPRLVRPYVGEIEETGGDGYVEMKGRRKAKRGDGVKMERRGGKKKE